MAIDTPAKRSAMMAMTPGWRTLMAEPDGDVDDVDKYMLLWLYSVADFAGPSAATTRNAFVKQGTGTNAYVKQGTGTNAYVKV